MQTWIKICGTTCIEDALASLEAGADALGFVFAASKRQVSAEQVAAITAQMPSHIARIGVFNNHSVAQVSQSVERAGLTGVQLHGDESPAFIAELRANLPAGKQLRVIKTVLVDENFNARFTQVCRNYRGIDSILLDSGAGSGKKFDWEKAKPLLEGNHKRLIVAGGLCAENVGEAIRKFSPWGVDVVSGVEREPGRKDPEKLKAFVAAVKRVKR